MEEQKPRELESQPHAPQSKKYPIICKFWMKGNCIKEDKCDYLHTEREKMGFQNFPLRSMPSSAPECSMYKLGFCKNGPLCNFKHVKETKTEEEIESLPELPIWYLEFILEKPINLIFKEFEEQNVEEITQLKEKYAVNKNINNNSILYYNAYMSNLTNNNFSTNTANNSLIRTEQKNSNNFSMNKFGRLKNNNHFIHSTQMQTQHINHLSYNNPIYKYDIYAEKKDSILISLNRRIRYFFIRNKNMDYVQFIMENNILLTTSQISSKIREAQKSCDECVLIIFDEE